MNESLLSTFVQVVESETLVHAAETLHVTQPTLTRRIQQLEQQVGMRLFERTGRRLVLNRAGELVYQYARRVLDLERKMADELDSLRDPEAGTIYVGAGLTPSIYLLPPLVAAYRTLHPRVQFRLRTGSSLQVLHALVQREVDLGIVTTVDPTWAEAVEAHPLFRDDLWLVAPPDHPLADGPPVSVEEVVRHPLVLMQRGSGLRTIVDRWLGGLDHAVAAETDSLESASRLVQTGVGLSILPRSCVQDDVAAHRLARIAARDDLGSRVITLVVRREGPMPASAERFAAFLPRIAEPSNQAPAG
ncbi:MAG: LysR family transcriptional regulator [Thermoflavifilum sp.]|nr:LysR family transcriptional regulator [Thermoflavifilum sp.]MCL6512970.1 LysR family transcriptional regulator [Alicyclobacillus sp.]